MHTHLHLKHVSRVTVHLTTTGTCRMPKWRRLKKRKYKGEGKLTAAPPSDEWSDVDVSSATEDVENREASSTAVEHPSKKRRGANEQLPRTVRVAVKIAHVASVVAWIIVKLLCKLGFQQRSQPQSDACTVHPHTEGGQGGPQEASGGP